MLTAIRDAMKQRNVTGGSALSRFVMPKLLVIDEIDKRYSTKWSESKLIAVLDGRYRAVRETIIIGNIKPDAFAASIGPSIVDRIHESGCVIECTWPSFRRAPR
jgi:DNA replication protein DnaC